MSNGKKNIWIGSTIVLCALTLILGFSKDNYILQIAPIGGLIVGLVAYKTNRDFWLWSTIGILTTGILIIPLLILIFTNKKNNKPSSQESLVQNSPSNLDYENTKTCPFCKGRNPLNTKFCIFCGQDMINYSSSESKFTNITTPDSQGFWVCRKCSFDKNADYTDMCSCCKTNKYSWEVLTDEERETIVEYVNLQMENNNFNDIYKLERNYYNTSSLLYLKKFFSGKLNYESIEAYRASLNACIQKDKSAKEQEPEETLTAESQSTTSEAVENEQTEKVDNLTEQLKKLKKLRDKDLINEEEYKIKKSQLLDL